VVANPGQHDRTGVIRLTLPAGDPLPVTTDDGTPVVTQVVAEEVRDALDVTVVGDKIAWVLERMQGTEVSGVPVAHVDRATRSDGSLEYRFVGTSDAGHAIDVGAVRDELRDLGEAGAVFRLRVTGPPEQVVLAAVTGIPGFGWRTVTTSRGEGGSAPDDRDAVGPAPVAVTGGEARPTLDNGLVAVQVDADGNGFSVEADGVRVGGQGRLVDGGDGGDTYNYSPPGEDRIVDVPVRATWTVDETGPVRGRIALDRTYEWPVDAVGDARSCSRRNEETVEVTVRTTLELRTGERFVRVRTELDNPCRDHRLRAVFPLPVPVDGSDAECAFAVVHRGLQAEGGPHEDGLPTFVSRRFVDAGDGEVGLALLHDGLLEYEVVDDGRALALTLLRATGYLSRGEPALRPNPAGPLEPLRGPQMLGPVVCDYAVMPHRGTWESAGLHARADELLGPLPTASVPPTSNAQRDAAGRELRVEGALVSAVTRADDGLTVRVFNPGADPSQLVIERGGAPASGRVVDLRDRTIGSFAGTRELRGGEIVTLRLR
jgi:hypothetical protein